MDEPTNHLDIKSKNVLKDALKKFEGTLILVSHDRDFLQGLTETIYEFKDQKIKQYLGDIDFYLEQRNLENLREAEKRTVVAKVEKTTNSKQSYEDQKKSKSLNNKLSNIESKINQLEKSIKEDDMALATNYDETAAKPEFFDAYQNKKKELDQLMEDWETVQESIDTLNFNN
jgi:ATP-binding cassette subfamily F protein 3